MVLSLIKKQLYEQMLLIRYFEEKIAQLFAKGRIHGTTHLYVGEEAVAAGVCCALDKKDFIFSTHRGHGHCIAKGIDINKMMAEFLGRQDGCCNGKGGSMHICDLDNNNYGTNGIVGGGIPLAVGAGLSVQMRQSDSIVACFFGDGATNQGTFHESLNLASVWRLPVLFVCEDNKYGFSMRTEKAMNIKKIEARAQSYGIPGQTIDGNDALLVFEQTKKAKQYVLHNGPMLLVCETYRISGHSKSDSDVYRSAQEIKKWQTNDPIKRLKQQMLESFSKSDLLSIEKRANQTIEKAVEYALNCPYPEKEALYCGVYA